MQTAAKQKAQEAKTAVEQSAERGADKASRAASDAKYAAEDGADKAKKVAQEGKEKASGNSLTAWRIQAHFRCVLDAYCQRCGCCG